MFVKRIRLSFASAGLMSCNYYQLVEMFYILLIGAMFHSSFFTHQIKKKNVPYFILPLQHARRVY